MVAFHQWFRRLSQQVNTQKQALLITQHCVEVLWTLKACACVSFLGMSENLLPGSPAADQHQLNCTGMIFLGMIKILFAWFTDNNRSSTTKFAPVTISFPSQL